MVLFQLEIKAIDIQKDLDHIRFERYTVRRVQIWEVTDAKINIISHSGLQRNRWQDKVRLWVKEIALKQYRQYGS